MKLSMRHVFAAHPLGGCRMADSKDYGVVDQRNEVFDNEGLFCIDSSATSTVTSGVTPRSRSQPSLERAVAQLIDRAADYGLPAKPAGFAPGVPGVQLGDHTTPVRRRTDDEVDAKVRSYAYRSSPPQNQLGRGQCRAGRSVAASGVSSPWSGSSQPGGFGVCGQGSLAPPTTCRT